MNMSRYIIRRIVAVSVAILLGALALALWRAQFDVRREGLGAADEVRLFEYLYALENGPAGEVDANLEALRRITRSQNLRHVRFTLADADGTVLVAPPPEPKPTLLQRAFAALAPGVATPALDPSGPWLLQREDGRRFSATLTLNPASEQQEAFDNLAGMLAVLLGYAVAILAAVYFTLGRALAPMRPILAAIDRFERNDFSRRVEPLPFAEIDAIGRALNHMADTLAAAGAQRRTLSLKLVSSQEDERTRMARELHDEFGQSLAALRADLSWMTRRTAGQAPLQEVLAGMTAQCERLQHGIRDLLARLHPLDARAAGFGASLPKLLGDLVRSWNERVGEHTRFELTFDADAEIPDDIALTVYRMTQEALTNSVRHARAGNVRVRVQADGRRIGWSVEDDGVGIGKADGSIQLGNGLAGMRERAWALGSELSIESAPHARGVRLAAEFDLNVRGAIAEA